MLKRFSSEQQSGNRSGKSSASIARRGLNWIPWQAIASHVARGAGFVDPGIILKRLRAFAKPSEVGEPIELLRAGAVFHARGLVNTRAIQFNLDWVWPYWVERQFNPHCDSFIPRAFSFSHINLTHRNWTAVGLPGATQYPIVDPRGLVTPLFDGWSLDFWLVGSDTRLLPSRCAEAEQTLALEENLVVRTEASEGALRMESEVRLEADAQGTWCVVRIHPSAGATERLVVALRPYNPEGVSFVDSIQLDASRRIWRVNGADEVHFSREPARSVMSCYGSGDVFHALARSEEQTEIQCEVGMATAAAVFATNEELELRIPVEQLEPAAPPATTPHITTWRAELDGCAQVQMPDAHWQRLTEAALATVILHTPGEVFPGPYTYRRFWYRDAAFILHALLAFGGRARTRRALELFPSGQMRDGYFRSQEGEWDSNGQVLWILEKYFSSTGETLPEQWREMVKRGARWIIDKRMQGAPHPGLLPAGFSAEHLGPNDYYYWDDFWGVAGLRAAAQLLRATEAETAAEFDRHAQEFLDVIDQSIARASTRTAGAMPAAPDRRMDSGAVGSLVADFPLQVTAPGDERILKTAEWLLAHSFVRGGFFQNMIHSGINAYLTLHVAQVLLRAGDSRAHQLIDAVADLASPTGQWPEAIHPRTLGGCMGDGQHVWAAAEWLVTMRNLFVREEADRLVIGAGIPRFWLDSGKSFGLARTLTKWGEVSVRFTPVVGEMEVSVKAARAPLPPMVVQVPGWNAHRTSENQYRLRRAY